MTHIFKTNLIARVKYSWFILLFLLLSPALKGAIETSSNRVTGASVITGSTVTAVDNKYTFMQATPTWYSAYFKVASGKGRVRCGVDHGSLTYVGSDYDYTFYLKIEYIDTTLGAATTVYRQLRVNYEYDGSVSYQDAAVYEVNTAKVVWIKATIDSIRNNVAGTYVSSAASNMYVEATTEVQRYYILDYATVPSNSVLFHTAPNGTGGITDSNEVRIEWNYIYGAEEYDLEWTYVNNHDGNNDTLPFSQVYYDFNHNSTRITTTAQYFHIPKLFDQGWLLFRVRAVGRAYDSGTGEWKRVYGKWTSDNVGSADTVNDFPSAHCYKIVAGHQRLMNWQYMGTFAEDGKKKEVMSYYDGSLRNRQTVTKTSTDKKVIVGETFYDYQGRPAVTALPAPVPGTDEELTYYPGFNRNDSTSTAAKGYSRFNFDKDVSSCTSVTRPMGTASGASYYYSAVNIDTNFQQGWLASAEKYPFAQVEYMPDNTGRVRRQGGVGPNHQLESKHETKYFYGQPYQEELDRLFGSEAGYKKHYNKTVTVDANGQASVSYMDQEGRVVATALAGQNPYNLTALANPAGTSLYLASKDTLTVELLAKDTEDAVDTDWDDNILSTDGKTLSVNTQLTVSFPQTYKFSYDLEGVEYATECLTDAICYECVYDLTIEIRDQCGNLVETTEETFGTYTETVGHFDTVCASAAASFSISPPDLNVSLTTGVYTVTKILSINEDTLEAYWQDFLERSSCVRSEQSFIDSALANVDTSGCHIDCDTCGDYEYVSQCEAGYQMMLSDVSPGGQYAEYLVAGTPAPTQYPLSVMNDDANTNHLPMYDATWRHPLRRDSVSLYDRKDSLHYFDHNHDIVRIPLVNVGGGNYNPPVISGATITTINGIPTVEPQELENLSDFVLFWQPTFAKSLVIYHPEYIYFQWCRENTIAQGVSGKDTLTSDEFDSLMIATTTIARAHQLGLLDPLANADGSASQTDCRDPYFRALGQGSHQYTTTNPDACDFSMDYQGNGISMWEMAKVITSCGTIFGTASDVEDCLESHLATTLPLANDTLFITTDDDWLAFRGLYFSIKQHFQSQAARDTSMYWDSYNGCIGNTAYNPFACGMYGSSWVNVMNWPFNDNRDTMRQHPCGITYNYYLGKVKRYPSEEDLNPNIATAWNGNPNSLLTAQAQQTNYSAQSQNGQCPSALALQELFNEISDANKLKTTDSLYNYNAFTYAMYDAMTSGSFTYPIWTPSGTGATLTIGMGAASGVSCSNMRLRFPSGSFTWNNYVTGFTIERFFNMQAIDPDSFTVLATVDHDLNPVTPGVDVLMTGSSGCYDISCATTSTVCTPSAEAREIYTLMNYLAVDNTKFFSTTGSGFRIDTGAIGAYFNSTQLRNRLGSGAYYWYKVSSTSFKIWNGSGSYQSLLITVPSMPATISYFSDLTLQEVDSIGMIAHYGVSTVNVGMEVRWYRNIGSPSDASIFLGECGSQVPVACVGDEFTRRDDFEALLNQLAIDDRLVSPTAYGTTLDTFSVFTNTLEAPLGYGRYRWIGSESSLTLTAEIHNSDSNWTACNVSMTFTATPPAGNSWDDAVLINAVWADESNLVNGVAYGFTGTAWFPGGKFQQFTGTSCYGLRNCNQCIPDSGNLYEDFENFNSVSPSFTTTLTYDATCPSSGEYTVTDSASVLCGVASYKNLDHTQPNAGSYYFTRYGSAAQTLWSTSTTVSAYTAYNFSVWYMDADTTANTHVTLQLWVDGALLTSVAVTDNPGTWKLLTGRWNGAATSGSKTIQVKTTGGGSVDSKLAIDDIGFYTIGCEPAVVLQLSPTYPYSDSCRQHQVNIATMNGQNQYAQYIDSTEQDFKARYIAHCMGEAIENFKVEYVLNEYQYTLYYYDQGGNLVKTVPPQGVNIVNLDTYGQDIKDDRAASTVNPAASKTFFTSHTMATRYTYNTLNQLTQQITPDGDTTRFWYDPLGRIVLSQNGNQEELISSKRRYSYTKYDEQGRIEEVGELSSTNDITAQSYSTQQTWLADANFPDLVDGAAVGVSNPRYQVTKTYYDATTFSSAAARMPSATQSNLRKRVVSAALYPYYAGTDTKYTTASHYSYDIHGNVKELVQEDSTLRSFDDAGNSRYQSYKTFEYTYDLVSGNVNMLAYQHGQADAFYYRYEYDADNRVTAAYTHAGPLVTRMSKGSTGVGGSGGSVMASSPELWDRDAKYFYYQHGPLARAEVGHNKVQASDYAYTLHGWIKGVNSNALTSVKDMGNDAHTDVSTAPIVNRYVGGDKYGYQLTYYDSTGKKDYTSITTNAAFASQSGSSLSTSSYNLWNGNIKNMVTSISSFMPNGRPQARAFTYDQLNRIKVAQVDTAYTVASNSWTTSGNLNQWKETFLYDYNGNIKTLVRHGKSPTAMDSLTYNYNNGRNQLNYVDDPISSGNYGTDIDDQAANNYIYDSIGNLTKDVSEEIDSIIWNVYGKIDRVVRTLASSRSDLEFRYDAMGNRICKIVKPRTAGVGIQNQTAWTYTYYMRDASGNVIAAYDRDYSTPGATYGDTLSLIENHLYGSSRVGIRTVNEVVCTTTYTYVSTSNGIYTGTFSTRTATAASTTNFNHELRRKAYELSNHLGNVLTTVSDARNPVNSGGTITTFSAVTLSAQDYYAFGSTMAGRSYTSSSYRYQFNGKEKDGEFTEGSLDFGARVYESRLGRWMSVDPLASKYSFVSPYAFAVNTPFTFRDDDGRDVYLLVWFTSDGNVGHSAIAVDNYKRVETKVIENGQEVTKVTYVKDGTVTYYDLWPDQPVGPTEYQSGVTADYNSKTVQTGVLTAGDPSRSGEDGKVSETGEGRVADGVIKVSTGVTEEEQYKRDEEVKARMDGLVAANAQYNACENNCSTFAQEGIKAATGDNTFDASQEMQPTGAASILYDDATVVAPNNLYNKTAELPGATVIRGPERVTAKPFIEYFGKQDRSTKPRWNEKVITITLWD